MNISLIYNQACAYVPQQQYYRNFSYRIRLNVHRAPTIIPVRYYNFHFFNRPIYIVIYHYSAFTWRSIHCSFTKVWSIEPKYKLEEENRAENLSVGRGFVYGNGAIFLIFYTYQRLAAEGRWRLAVKSFSGNFRPRRIPASANQILNGQRRCRILLKIRYFFYFTVAYFPTRIHYRCSITVFTRSFSFKYLRVVKQ